MQKKKKNFFYYVLQHLSKHVSFCHFLTFDVLRKFDVVFFVHIFPTANSSSTTHNFFFFFLIIHDSMGEPLTKYKSLPQNSNYKLNQGQDIKNSAKKSNKKKKL